MKIIRVLMGPLLLVSMGATGGNPQFQENFRRCVGGYMGCDQSLLTAAQQEQVSRQVLRRNFVACDGGYSGCVHFLQTDAQKEQVRKSALLRNFVRT